MCQSCCSGLQENIQGSTGPSGTWGQPPARVLMYRGSALILCNVLQPAGAKGSVPRGSDGAVKPWSYWSGCIVAMGPFQEAA